MTPLKPGLKQVGVSTFQVGHSAGEFYIRLGEIVIILPPAAIKQFVHDLRALHLPDELLKHPEGEKQRDTMAKKAIKALFKSRRVTKSLISINTGRRKKLPDR